MRHHESDYYSLQIVVKCCNLQVPVQENYRVDHYFEMGVVCGCDFLYYETSGVVIKTNWVFERKSYLLKVLLGIFWLRNLRIVFIIESWCIESVSPAQRIQGLWLSALLVVFDLCWDIYLTHPVECLFSNLFCLLSLHFPSHLSHIGKKIFLE